MSKSRTGNGPSLVLAHGFTQTRRVWGSMDADLARDHQVTAVDMPGHGGSTQVAADLLGGATLLGEAGGTSTYVGYSMGARFCLHLALARPDVVERLVLISGTAGIDDPEERRARRLADEALAERLDPLAGGPPADTVESFVARWMANPLFGSVPAERDGHAERVRNTGSGLASSLRLAGTGTQRPLWADLQTLAMPVLVVCGERDAKFRALGARLTGAIGAACRLVTVPGTDHACHLQQPERVADTIRTFVAAT